MALATQCPYCHTTFRVAHDQLKLRAGLVRCGACKQIFNGIEHLLRQEDEALSNGSPARPTEAEKAHPAASSAAAVNPAPANDEPGLVKPQEQTTESGADDAVPPEPASPTTIAPDDEDNNDPLQRMTLIDFASPGQDEAPSTNAEAVPAINSDPNEADPLTQAIEELQSKPLRSEKISPSRKRHGKEHADDASDEEPSFVRQGRRRRRINRALHIFTQAGSALLLLTLFGQGTYLFRNQLAVAFPAFRPALEKACIVLDCKIGLPAQIDAVSIESSELQAVNQDKNIFSLNALLRNHSSTAQAWPNVELTLIDANEKPLARKIFTARDYLSSGQEAAKGFGPKSEQNIKLFFELAGLKAAGYRVYLFYP